MLNNSFEFSLFIVIIFEIYILIGNKLEWKREKYNFLREVGDTKCFTRLSKYRALDNFKVIWLICLFKVRCSSK
jgi:hypothetical protein